MNDTNISGIILEGIAGTGKTTLLRAILESDAWTNKSHMSSVILTEHQTLRVLEPKRENNSYSTSDSIQLLDKHISYLCNLKNNLDSTDWLQRDRTAQQLSFIFERFHLSHLYHYDQLEWRDVKYIDAMFKNLSAKIILLTINDEDIQERIIEDYKKAGWKDYLETLGNTDDEIISHFSQKQNKLLDLARLSTIPIEVINTSELKPDEVLETVIKSSKFVH